MANQPTETTGKRSKKEFRKAITEKLKAALTDFKDGLSEKKFAAALKRAGKSLSRDLITKAKKKKRGKVKTEVPENIGM